MKRRMKLIAMVMSTAILATTPVFATETTEMVGAYEEYAEEGVSAEAQEAFDKAMENFEGGDKLTAVQLLETQIVSGVNYRILCEIQNEEDPGKKEVVTIYQNLDGNCEVIAEVKVVAPLVQGVSMEGIDFESAVNFEVADFNWDDKTLTFDVCQDALYDMVEMANMELDTVVEVDGKYITVESIEEGETTRVNSEGTEEKAATITINKGEESENYFVAYEGGTWITVLPNDYVGKVKIEELTLPLAEAIVFTDCTEDPSETVEVAPDQLEEHLNAQEEAGKGLYTPFDTKITVENGEIVSIVRSWRP